MVVVVDDVDGVVVGAIFFTVVVGATVVVVGSGSGTVVGIGSSIAAFRVRWFSSNVRSSAGGRTALTSLFCRVSGILASTLLISNEPVSTTTDLTPVDETVSRLISFVPVCLRTS